MKSLKFMRFKICMTLIQKILDACIQIVSIKPQYHLITVPYVIQEMFQYLQSGTVTVAVACEMFF